VKDLRNAYYLSTNGRAKLGYYFVSQPVEYQLIFYAPWLRLCGLRLSFQVTRKDTMKTLMMAHKVMWMVLIICLVLMLFPMGCIPTKESSRGFRLPEGSVEQGKLAFTELGCVRCHTIAGKEDVFTYDSPREIEVVLGGETTRVKTYGQLVTSVIYPDHIILPKYRENYTDRDGNSEMADLTDEMTVKQLIDLVTFLETTYKVVPPDYAYEVIGP